MPGSRRVKGTNAAAEFELTIHRGEGTALVTMDWRGGQPPDDFDGFAIEYREPRGKKFFAVKNRLNFEETARCRSLMSDGSCSVPQPCRRLSGSPMKRASCIMAFLMVEIGALPLTAVLAQADVGISVRCSLCQKASDRT